MFSEKIEGKELKVSGDTFNVYNICGMFCSEQGTLLFADYENRSVKELQLQTKTLKTLYRSDWRVLNVLLHSDLQTVLVCEQSVVYVLCLRSVSLLSFFCFGFLSRITRRKWPLDKSVSNIPNEFLFKRLILKGDSFSQFISYTSFYTTFWIFSGRSKLICGFYKKRESCIQYLTIGKLVEHNLWSCILIKCLGSGD